LNFKESEIANANNEAIWIKMPFKKYVLTEDKKYVLDPFVFSGTGMFPTCGIKDLRYNETSPL